MESEELVSCRLRPLFSDACLNSFAFETEQVKVFCCTRNFHEGRVIFEKSVILDGDTKKDHLFCDNIWPGSITISSIFADNPEIVLNKTVLEFGAGSALPSLLCIALGSKIVTITDYPAPGILENIDYLVNMNKLAGKCSIGIMPHMFGQNCDDLLSCIPQETQLGYDVIILAELLWKDTYKFHRDILANCKSCLHEDGTIYISFCHRECESHSKENDLEFFEIAEEQFEFVYIYIGGYLNKNYGIDDTDILVHYYQMRKKSTTR